MYIARRGPATGQVPPRSLNRALGSMPQINENRAFTPSLLALCRHPRSLGDGTQKVAGWYPAATIQGVYNKDREFALMNRPTKHCLRHDCDTTYGN
ncbi:uncharacterized protein ARMOST_13332 [Armillaria ostoyae]|uniref:Uncharacterized protein n=1 Tax=Armillaria ostoyae TaxID=47428 RepID=A0A284RMG0_ARMOS|nr:uncharacterized protein ARMOST_13332 [Armillaria ostoyae]